MDLASCAPGDTVCVVGVCLDDGMRRRCRELGLCVGALVRVTHRGAFGGRVLALGAHRLAVDATTCAAVEVAPWDGAPVRLVEASRATT